MLFHGLPYEGDGSFSIEAAHGASDELRTYHAVMQQKTAYRWPRSRILTECKAQEKGADTQVQEATKKASAASQTAIHFVRHLS